MGTWTLVQEIIVGGFFLAGVFGVVYVIIWAFIRNIKWLFGSTGSDKQLTDWFAEGLRNDHDPSDLHATVLLKGYKPKKVDKSLKEAFKIIIREVERENVKQGNGLGDPKEEIEKLKGQK